MPTDFALSESDKQHAFQHGWTPDKLASELARFRDHANANGRKQADWHAAWRNWVSSPFQKPQIVNGSHAAPQRKSVADVGRELAERLGREASEPDDWLFPQIGRQ